MAKFLNGILQEPARLAQSLAHTLGPGRNALTQAAVLLKSATEIIITGIGGSWHAGMAIESLFTAHGENARLIEASELLYFAPLRKNAVVIMLSRSGASIEIVKLLDKAKAAGANVIAITNTPDSPLAKRANIVLHLATAFDHNVSVTMYSAIALVGGLLAAAATDSLNENLQRGLAQMLNAAADQANNWLDKIEKSNWFFPMPPTYFLARAGSLASAFAARLLWEEAAKTAATSMTTGGFRHGPQEIIPDGLRVGLWLDQNLLRDEDFALIADLRRHGVKVMLIGQNIPDAAADLVLPLPPLPPACNGWQFLTDIIPAQLAAYRLAKLLKVDPDNFLVCPYIITTESGLPAAP